MEQLQQSLGSLSVRLKTRFLFVSLPILILRKSGTDRALVIELRPNSSRVDWKCFLTLAVWNETYRLIQLVFANLKNLLQVQQLAVPLVKCVLRLHHFTVFIADVVPGNLQRNWITNRMMLPQSRSLCCGPSQSAPREGYWSKNSTYLTGCDK